MFPCCIGADATETSGADVWLGQGCQTPSYSQVSHFNKGYQLRLNEN